MPDTIATRSIMAGRGKVSGLARQKAERTLRPGQTLEVVNRNASRKGGFAPGSRPGVITRSGRNVFKDGKLVVNARSEEKAQEMERKFLGAGYKGRIHNVQGDKQGQTFRSINRTDKGTQTGLANVGAIKESMESRGYVPETVTDEQGQERVVGALTARQSAFRANEQKRIAEQSQRAYVAGQPFARRAPVLREEVKEKETMARIAQEAGIDVNKATTAQLMRLREATNMNVYGTGRPNFQEGVGISAKQKAEEQAIDALRSSSKNVLSVPKGITETSIDSSIVTSRDYDAFANSEIGKFEDYDAMNYETVNESFNGLIESDPDILSAQLDGDEMQILLEEKRKFYEDQYSSLKEEIEAIYDAKESDYKQQAEIALAESIAQMASIGAFGVSTGAMRYVDSVSRENNAKIMALATEEATALNEAYTAFVTADFEVAEAMINNAKSTREEIRAIKADQLNRQKQLMELRQMEREDASQTISAIVSSGMDASVIPEGYMSYLDQKSGYPEGTSLSLFNITKQELETSRQAQAYKTAQEQAQFEMQQASELVSILSKIPPGQSIEIGGMEYSSLSTGETITGTETGADGRTYLWTYNKDTGEQTTRDLGISGSQNYEDFNEEGRIVRVYQDGTARIMYDPNQPSGGYATGGLLDMFPSNSMSPFSRSEERGGKKMATECGAWVNDITGLGVGSTYESKKGKMDESITAESAQIGDVFIQPYGTTGHIGIINGKSVVNGEVVFTVSESNWKKDKKGYGLITHERQIRASEITGYARPGFLEPEYNFGTDAVVVPEKIFSGEEKESFIKIGAVKKLENGRVFRQRIIDYMSLLEEYGGAVISPTQKKNLRAVYGDIIGALKSSEALGTLDKGLLDYVEKRVPSPERLIGITRLISSKTSTVNTLKDIIGRIDQDANMHYQDIISQYPEYESYGYLNDLMGAYGYEYELE